MLSAFRKGGKCVGRKTGYFLLLLLIFFGGEQVFTVSGSRGSSRF